MLQDLRFCLRSLLRNPGFAVVAILTIALGVGANTAIFSLVNSVLLRPLPVSDPGQLVALEEPGGGNASLSYPTYRDLQQRAEAFRGQLLAMSLVSLSAFSGSNATVVHGEIVTGNYYDVLRVAPALGRFFAPDDDRPGVEAVAVVSWPYWQRELGGSAQAVGRQIVLNGRKVTVIGVEPEGFFGARMGVAIDVRLPMNQAPEFRSGTRLDKRNQRWLIAMGRIQPGNSLAAARASMDVTFQQLVEEDISALPPNASPGVIQGRRAQRVSLQPAPGGFRNSQRGLATPLWLLLGVTGLVLLIACANLAGLLIVRGEFRRREIAMRSALGASTSRLVRHLLTEGLAIATAGGVAGLLLSLWVTPVITAMIPANSLASSLVTPDSRVLAYALATATFTGLLFALAPAVRTARGGQGELLRAGASTGGGQMLRFRGALLAGQVALSMVLLIGAGLFIRTLLNLRGQETGFTRHNVLTATIAPYMNGYKAPASLALMQDLLARVRSLPGVRGAGFSNESLMAGGWDQNGIIVEGLPAEENGRGLSSRFDSISPGYVGAVRLQLLAGRDFNERDTPASPKVALVNEAFAARFFPGQNPLGRHIGFSEPGAKPGIEIVGVLRNAKYVELREGQAPPYVYLPYTQAPLFEQTLHVAVAGDPLAIAGALRDQWKQIDPQLPMANVRSLDNQIDQSMSGERALAWLTAAFGLLATGLSAVGLYGVLAYTVTRRTREIGVRMALGAQPADVIRTVIRNTGWLTVAGLVTGAALSLVAGRFLKSLLYGVETADPLTYASAAAVLLAAALTASLIPARRASRVDPMEALRCE